MEKEEKRKRYENFFNSQKEIFFTLLQNPCFCFKDKVINEMIFEFEDLKENVIEKALKMNIQEKNTPFAFVLPKKIFGIVGLLSLLRFRGLKGMLDFNPEKIFRKESHNLHNMYVIYDIRVDSDNEVIGKSFRESSLFLKSNNRFVLTYEELMSFCFFNPKWFYGCYNMGCSTFFVDDECSRALCLYLRGKKCPNSGFVNRLNLGLVDLDEKDDYLIFPSHGTSEINFL